VGVETCSEGRRVNEDRVLWVISVVVYWAEARRGDSVELVAGAFAHIFSSCHCFGCMCWTVGVGLFCEEVKMMQEPKDTRWETDLETGDRILIDNVTNLIIAREEQCQDTEEEVKPD